MLASVRAAAVVRSDDIAIPPKIPIFHPSLGFPVPDHGLV